MADGDFESLFYPLLCWKINCHVQRHMSVCPSICQSACPPPESTKLVLYWKFNFEPYSGCNSSIAALYHLLCILRDNEFHGANMGPTWVLLAPWTLLSGLHFIWVSPLGSWGQRQSPPPNYFDMPPHLAWLTGTPMGSISGWSAAP